MLGPVLLCNRFKRQVYYNHFMLLAQILNACLRISISESYVEEKLRPSIIQWVKKYEQ